MNQQIDNATLVELYRRSCERRGEACLDADTLVALAEGSLDAAERERVSHLLGQSPQQADVVKLLLALAPASQQLAQAAKQNSAAMRRGHLRVVACVPRHQLPVASVRSSPRRRPALRWLAAAAVVIAVAGSLGWQSLHSDQQPAMASTTPASMPAAADTIFNASMNGHLAVSDEATDQIFSSSFRRQKRG